MLRAIHPSMFAGWLLVSAGVAASAGCGGLNVQRAAYDKGSVLVLPVRDVTMSGRPDAEGKDSGKQTNEHLAAELAKRGWSVVEQPQPGFDHATVADAEAAVAAGQKAGAALVLQVALGEFLDVKLNPVGSDRVTVEQAKLYHAGSGKVVWELSEPTIFKQRNAYHYRRLLAEIAQQLVASITEPQ